MKIQKIEIKNFRALQHLTITLSNMTVIIGENDCGKTSVMLALQTFFDAKKISDENNFFKKVTNTPIEIVIIFSDFKDRFKDLGIMDTLEVKRTFAFNEAPLTEIKNNNKFEKAPKNIDKLLPDFVLVPVDRSLSTHGKMTSTSLFGKLFQPLVKQVIGSQCEETTKEIQRLMQIGVAQRIDDLQKALIEQLNNPNVMLKHEIKIDLLKGIDIPIDMSDERVANIPIENRGAGIQSSFILALFRIYAKYETPDFILAIEEPENSLHPRAQREMRWAMQDFSLHSQVICTTHSPVFLDLGRLEDNIILRRKSNGATEPSYFNLRAPNELRDIVGIKVSDALLGGGGNCSIIVEGETEMYAYPHLFRCIGVNPRGLGISIINAGGSDFKKLYMHAKILNAYNLPCIIVVDKDKCSEAEKLEARGLANLKLVHPLEKGNFEEYLPLDIAVEVLNELCLPNSPEAKPLSKFDVNTALPIENQLSKLVHDRFIGERFPYLKVRLGEEVGKMMAERNIKPDEEIITILNKAQEIAIS